MADDIDVAKLRGLLAVESKFLDDDEWLAIHRALPALLDAAEERDAALAEVDANQNEHIRLANENTRLRARVDELESENARLEADRDATLDALEIQTDRDDREKTRLGARVDELERALRYYYESCTCQHLDGRCIFCDRAAAALEGADGGK